MLHNSQICVYSKKVKILEIAFYAVQGSPTYIFHDSALNYSTSGNDLVRVNLLLGDFTFLPFHRFPF